MTDFSTRAAQASHYSAVKARLGLMARSYVRRPLPVRPVTIPAPQPDPEPEIHERDWLVIPSTLNDSSPLRWRAIVREVAAKHGVPFAKIIGPGRERGNVSPARQEAMYRVRHETKLSFPQIGRHFGNRDHSTVCWAVDKHRKKMEAANV